MPTSSSLFLKTLADLGITHVFANWGSDHPALLEDLAARAGAGATPAVVTCPHEMVALSAAQGYAQAAGAPAAVVVHVDVGTQGLAGAVHNVDRCRTPVLIYAGASAFTIHGELKGTRNEWIMGLQDVPDQAAIVRQYMRLTSQIHSPKHLSQVVRRSLQIESDPTHRSATSEPKGPVYLWARREVMEEDIDDALMDAPSNPWPPIEPCAFSPTAASRIAAALRTAHAPLIVTSSLGRNPHAIPPLLALSNLLAIPIVAACPNVVNAPFSHPFFAGFSYLQPGTHSPHIASADVVLVLDADTPWIPAHGKGNVPRDDARVFVVDGADPLKTGTGFWHVDAEMVCKADAQVALGQIVETLREIDMEAEQAILGSKEVKDRGQILEEQHKEWVHTLEETEDRFIPAITNSDTSRQLATITVPNVLGVLRRAMQAYTPSKGLETLVLNESISNYPLVWTHLRSERAGSHMTSGGSSLGWALGAAVGAILGGDATAVAGSRRYELVVAIVGDGSFLFGVPSSAYWMARRYDTPFLTIVLNNGGWKSPKLSMQRLYPNGHGSKVTANQLTVGFGPDCPDYSQIAVAASGGWAWGKRVDAVAGRQELEKVIAEAVKVVVNEKRCAVVDCVLETI